MGYESRAQALPALVRQRIVPLDGAMGTMIQQRHLSEMQFRGDRFADHPGTLKGNNELLNPRPPDIVREIHEAHGAAGSDIVETNAFGAIGPTPCTASISPDINDPGARNVDSDEPRAAYREQVDGLVEGEADILLVETIFHTLNAKAAAFAIDSRFGRVHA
jgi:5-methyltetrahydrofolate--homocysteine methyltransferase